MLYAVILTPRSLRIADVKYLSCLARDGDNRISQVTVECSSQFVTVLSAGVVESQDIFTDHVVYFHTVFTISQTSVSSSVTHRPTPDQTELRCCTELMSQMSVSSSVHTQAYTRPDRVEMLYWTHVSDECWQFCTHTGLHQTRHSWDAVLNSCHRWVLAVLYTHRPTPDQTELRCCTELMSQMSVSSSVHTQAYTRPDRVEMLYWTHVTDEC